MVAHEAPTRNPEKQTKVPEIPKSREIFTGDINDAVIAVQQITGFEITPEWWMNEVGNDGTTEEILDKFDNAFEKFVFAELGIEADERTDSTEDQLAPSEIVSEAESEMDEFDNATLVVPELEPLRVEFLNALKAHLQEKYFGLDHINEAWQEYSGYDDDYMRRNDERAKTRKIQVVRSSTGDLTAVASININPETGEAKNGHDKRPEAQSHLDTEKVWHNYLDETPDNERFVIFEGEPDFSETRDEAISEREDSGLIQYLSREAGLQEECIKSGDPNTELERAELEKLGFPLSDIKFYELIRHLTYDPSHESPDLNLEIYGNAAIVGIEGFQILTNEEKSEILKRNGAVEVLRAKAARLTTELNTRLESLGLPQFSIDDRGDISLDQKRLEKLNSSWDPRSEGLLADIQRASLEIRDKHLFEQIVTAIRLGKKPFVLYGGSHITALQPALEKL